MQFAGQRTDTDLNPLEEPHNYFIKLTEDVLPEPEAVLITGITPQKTLQEGYTEAEFLRIFTDKISVPDTIFVGFNTVRFDDEFMRFMLFRNYYDPYEWQWKDGRSRWDLLDVVRMMRALRPEGIKWPFDDKGNPTNRLELLTEANDIDHGNAHDALSDVKASIALARIIKNKQPKLFDFLLSMRDKANVAELVESGQPFVYASGKFANEFEKTTVAATVGKHPERSGAALVFDLRFDPQKYATMTTEQITEAWRKPLSDPDRLPVKTLIYNRCPAIAPLGVLTEANQERLSLSIDDIRQRNEALKSIRQKLHSTLIDALKLMDESKQAAMPAAEAYSETQLYEGFIPDIDKAKMSVVRAADEMELASLRAEFNDQRLREMLPRYKARNFPKTLSTEERQQWERYRYQKLLGGGEEGELAKYLRRLTDLAANPKTDNNHEYLLQELQLYAESIMPEDV